jgi:hypothetical protein
MTTRRKTDAEQNKLDRAVNALRRYPVKPWLR